MGKKHVKYGGEQVATRPRRDRRRPIRDGDDKRVQKVMLYLWGTWGVDDLRRKIARLFDARQCPALPAVAQSICDIYCGGEGYSDDDIVEQLRRVLPAQQ